MGYSRGADGWSVLTPSSDSRLIYVDYTNGSDTGDHWKSPSDPEVGADPFDPSGDVTPYKTLAVAKTKLRDGYPDWILFKRGETWTGEVLGNLTDSGRSGQERIVIGAYGDTATARPIIRTGNTNFITVAVGTLVRYWAVLDLELYNHAATGPQTGTMGIRLGHVEDFLIEGNRFRKYDQGVSPYRSSDFSFSNKRIEVRRNVFDNSLQQGMLAQGNESLTIEENVYDRSGFWEDRDNALNYADQFKHCFYMGSRNPYSGHTIDNRGKIIIRNNFITRASATGVQLRCGGTFEHNVLMECPLAIITGEGEDNKQVFVPEGVDSDVDDNLIVYGTDLNSDATYTANYKRGTAIQAISTRVARIRRNTILHDESVDSVNNWGIRPTLMPSGPPVTSMTLDANVFYDWPKGAVGTSSPVESFEDAIASETNNVYYDRATARPSGVWPLNESNPDNIMVVAGQSSGNQDGEGLTFIDDGRTPETYFDYISSVARGTKSRSDLYTALLAQRKGNWNAALSAQAMHAWVRAGFVEGDPIPPEPPGVTRKAMRPRWPSLWRVGP